MQARSCVCQSRKMARMSSRAFNWVSASPLFRGKPTAVLKQARRGLPLPCWIVSLLKRRPYKVAAIALTNRMVRIIWAPLVKGGTCQAPVNMAKA